MKQVYGRSLGGRTNDFERNPLSSLDRRLEQVLRESSEFVRIPWDSGRYGNTIEIQPTKKQVEGPSTCTYTQSLAPTATILLEARKVKSSVYIDTGPPNPDEMAKALPSPNPEEMARRL
nr:hypothetical protein CFP56_57178 [Quercus suber]